MIVDGRAVLETVSVRGNEKGRLPATRPTDAEKGREHERESPGSGIREILPVYGRSNYKKMPNRCSEYMRGA